MFCRARVLRFVALVALAGGLIAQGDVLAGGFTTICKLSPYNDGIRTPFISGIAFDNQANPWVIDGLTWQMQRLDETSGAVLQTFSPTLPTTYNYSLAWSAASGDFYTTGDSMDLYRIGHSSGTTTDVGQMATWVLGFPSFAFDPAGKLWMSDSYSELASVNTNTGKLTFERSITGLKLNQQTHALAIDGGGQFFVASSASGDNCIYRVNPQTGAASLVSEWTDDIASFINDFAFDPATGQCFGIREARNESPYGYYFVQLTGVPEPSTLALLLAGAAGLLGCAWRRKRHFSAR
jgi:hypothetical protein